MAKWHNTIKGRTKEHQEKANFVAISNTDFEQNAEAINVKPTPGTAPGTQLFGEVSYFFCQPIHWTAYFDKPNGVKLGIFC